MSKLLKLKEWLSIPDVAKHLTAVFKEDVSEADVIRFGLDGKIGLSVLFVQATLASPCRFVDLAEIEYFEVPSFLGSGIVKFPVGGKVFRNQRGETFQALEEVVVLDDTCLYDLPMFGDGRSHIVRRYWKLASGPELVSAEDGVFVSNGSEIFRLMQWHEEIDDLPEGSGHVPLFDLPDAAVLVVRTGELLDFVRNVQDGDREDTKPLSTRERNNLLALIAVLCREAKYDYGTHAKTAALIVDAAARHGITLGESTVEVSLKRVPGAISNKIK